MRTYYDCIPCFIRQALEAARLATSDEQIHEEVLRGILAETSKMDLKKSPPAMGQRIHEMIRKLSGNEDPYKELKERYNRFSLDLYPELKKRIEHSSDPLEMAARLAIAGNIIDFGVNIKLDQPFVHEIIERSLTVPLFGDFEKMRNEISLAEKILYIGDNAGEIVFDRLLIEQLSVEKITYAVKGSPVINDAAMADAEAAGMTDLVEVIDNGYNAPGTIIEKCSEQFRRYFFGADLIIAKGQGNYESLSEMEQSIFFMLQAKCPVIAIDIGCEVGSFVVENNL